MMDTPVALKQAIETIIPIDIHARGGYIPNYLKATAEFSTLPESLQIPTSVQLMN